MGFYSMPRYFRHLPQVGKPLKKADADNTEKLKKIEDEIHALIKQAQDAGKADADVNKRGELTARQRLEKLVEPGTWRPLNSLFNPQGNKNGSVGVLKGLGRVNGNGAWSLLPITRSWPAPGSPVRLNACCGLPIPPRPCTFLWCMC